MKHGPISLMMHTLEQAGTGCSDPEEWWHRGTASLCCGRGDGTQVAPVCRALSGLVSGRNEKAMHALMGEIRSPIEKRMLGLVHPDSVYSGSWALPMGF